MKLMRRRKKVFFGSIASVRAPISLCVRGLLFAVHAQFTIIRACSLFPLYGDSEILATQAPTAET